MVRWMCALAKIKPKWSRHRKAAKKEESNETTEWVTVYAVEWVTIHGGEKKRKSGTNFVSAAIHCQISKSLWFAPFPCQSNAKTNSNLAKQTVEQSYKSWTTVSDCVHTSKQTQPCIRRSSWVNFVFRDRNKKKTTNLHEWISKVAAQSDSNSNQAYNEKWNAPKE